MKAAIKYNKGIMITSASFKPSNGGVQTHLDDLCRYLVLSGFRVFVVTCQPTSAQFKGRHIERSNGLLIIRLPLWGWDLFSDVRLRSLYEMLSLFLGSLFLLLIYYRNISVIHGHGFAYYLKPLKCIFPAKRVVLSTHNLFHFHSHSSRRNMIVRWMLSSMDFILAVSEQSRDELIEAGLDTAKIKVFHQWVNHDIFKPIDKAHAKKEVGWSKHFIVLFVGRFVPEKGAGLLMQVAEKADKGITFAFIGDGPMSAEIERDASVRENVLFIGKIQNENLPVYLNASDILVIPSQWEDPRPRIILEALSCGLPVIGTKRGGIPETLNDEVGVLVSPPEKDVENILKAISELYYNRDKLALLSRNAIKYTNDKYSDKNAELILKSYG